MICCCFGFFLRREPLGFQIRVPRTTRSLVFGAEVPKPSLGSSRIGFKAQARPTPCGGPIRQSVHLGPGRDPGCGTGRRVWGFGLDRVLDRSSGHVSRCCSPASGIAGRVGSVLFLCRRVKIWRKVGARSVQGAVIFLGGGGFRSPPREQRRR